MNKKLIPYFKYIKQEITDRLKKYSMGIFVLACLVGCVGTNTDIYYGYSKSGVISNFDPSALKSRHLDMVNALRIENGIAPLKFSNSLSAAAKTHAFDIARQQRAWNYGSDASSPKDRAETAGFKGLVLGENVSETYEGEYEILNVWFKTAIGREIILHPKATHLGLSYYQDSTGKVWWVQMLGNSLS